jgi:hypothetical protein
VPLNATAEEVKTGSVVCPIVESKPLGSVSMGFIEPGLELVSLPQPIRCDFRRPESRLRTPAERKPQAVGNCPFTTSATIMPYRVGCYARSLWYSVNDYLTQVRS